MKPLVLLLCTVLAAGLLPAEEPFGIELVAELNRARAERGLAALESDPELARVGARRAAAMATEGWFGLVSPAGQQVEDDLDAAGWAFRLVTEKLVRSNAGARELVDEWRVRPNDQLQSLFHPGVTRIGVGVAESAGGRIVDVVLATPMGAATVAGASPFEPEAQARERAALVELVGAARAEAKLLPLRHDAMLEEAAQEHAAAILASFAAGKGVESVELLADRLSRLEYRRSPGSRGLTRSEDSFGVRELSATPGGPSLHGKVTGAIVVDARTAEDALHLLAAAAETRPNYLEPPMARLGIGIAGGAPEDGGRIVWVVATRQQ